MARATSIPAGKKGKANDRPFRPRNMPARRRRRRLVSVLVRGTIFCAVAGVVVLGISSFVDDSPTFRVRTVTVDGANVLREEAILAVADVTANDKLLETEPELIAKRIMAMPYVEHCEVQRAYPDRLIIRLVERVPAATIMVNQRAYEVDANGLVLREVDPLMPHEGPLLSNIAEVPALEPGFHLESAAFSEAMSLWEAWNTVPLSEELTLSEISAESPTFLRMFFEDLGYELRWGRSDYGTQALRLQVLWNEKQGKLPCKEYLDLRFDQDLACK